MQNTLLSIDITIMYYDSKWSKLEATYDKKLVRLKAPQTFNKPL